jgi:hypothetical protein
MGSQMKIEQHNNTQISSYFSIQSPFSYRRMERFFQTSFKCE